MKNAAFILCLFCVGIGVFGALGILNGPYIGIEYRQTEQGSFVDSIRKGSPAEASGLPRGSRLVSIASIAIGKWDLMDDIDVIPDLASVVSNFKVQYKLGQLLRPGLAVPYVFESPGGERREIAITPAVMPRALALSRLAKLFLPAIFCLAIGLAVIMKKAEDQKARIFFAMLVTISLVFLTFGSWSSRDTTMSFYIYFPLFLINDIYAFPYFPVLFFRFCLSFPRDLRPAKSKAFIACLFVSPILMLALFLPRLVFEIQPIFWASGLLGGAAIMIRQYVTLRSPLFRAQVKWILWGSIFFGVCMVLTYTLPILLRTPDYYSWFIPSVVFLIIPLTFSFAILRYRLMDIDALFDATFVYTITVGLLLALDALVSLGLSLISGQGGKGYDLVASFLAIQLAIVLYLPIRSRVAVLIKRLFRREYYEPDKVAAAVAENLILARDAESALESMRVAIDETLHPVYASAAFFVPGGRIPDSLGADGGEAARLAARLAAQIAGRFVAPQAGDRPFTVDEAVESGLVPESMSGGVAVPLAARGRLIGLLFLGPKRSRNYYSASDLRLLGMISRQTALAVEGALVRLEADRSVAELRGERDRVSREIHDGVGGTLSNAIMLLGLIEGERDRDSLGRRLVTLKGLLSDALADLRSLVWALHDGGGSPSELAIHLREKLEKAVSDRGIKVEFSADVEDSSAGLNARERLNLVRAFQELVANSLKHAQATKISLRIEESGGALLIRYADDGRGFDPQKAAPGYGLANIAKRSADIGAEFRLDAESGRGMSALIRVPLGAGRGQLSAISPAPQPLPPSAN